MQRCRDNCKTRKVNVQICNPRVTNLCTQRQIVVQVIAEKKEHTSEQQRSAQLLLNAESSCRKLLADEFTTETSLPNQRKQIVKSEL